ncbi:MAG TPA: DUF481 domain-containing protein [Vicinamibacterales bacterium]|nr:DUF481 domain-containing protein [Vicinamibacterales bacterium]
MRRVLLTCVCLLLPRLVAAQAAPAPPPRHESTGELAFVGTTGNSSTSTLSLAGDDIARSAPWLVRNRIAFVRNESGGALTAQSFLYAFRTERTLRPRLSAFGEYDYFRDRFSGVANRNTILGGVTYVLLDHSRQHLSVDGALGYLNEDRLAGDDVSSGTFATGALYDWKISATASLTDEARFTSAFDQASNWRAHNIASVTARLTGLFSLKVSYTVRYQHLPPPGFKTTDTTTAIALVAKFTRQ